MTAKEAWQKIITGLSLSPGDFKTVPKIKREPLWFNAKTDGKCVYINNANKESPSCKLTTPSVTLQDIPVY